MQDFGTKADNSPPPGGQLSAAEFNNLAAENENAVIHSGAALSGASSTQLAESLFLHGVKSASFQDSGVANAYVATPVSGAGGVLLPANYTNFGGAVVSFKASNANSAASTLNIGQTTGTLLGAKAIRTQADLALPSGSIVAGQYVELVYNPAFNAGAGAWELLPWSGSGKAVGVPQVFTVGGTYTPTTGTTSIIVEMVGGGGSGGFAAATGAGTASCGGGGGGGAYTKTRITSGFSGQAVTVGQGGLGINSGSNNGSASSFGALATAAGGLGGQFAGPSSQSHSGQGGNGGAQGVTGNIINSSGQPGSAGLFVASGATSFRSGNGGSGPFGGGGASGAPGSNATGAGAGGGGSSNTVSSAAIAGGNGSNGIVIIYEY